MKDKFNYILYCLKKNKIESLKISFDGYGDGGAMDISDATSPDEQKRNEVINYSECSPNTFLDEPSPFFCKWNKNKNNSFMDLIWELTHHIFLEKGLNWCRGHGNQGQIIFNVLENKIDMEFLEYSTKKEEIKL